MSFHPFPRFPWEIRNKIWNYASSSPQAQFFEIHLSRTKRTQIIVGSKSRRRGHDVFVTFKPKAPPPGLLQANHEARSISINNYERISQFSGKAVEIDPPPSGYDWNSWIFVNFAVDIFETQNISHLVQPSDLRLIKNLRVVLPGRLAFFIDEPLYFRLKGMEMLRELEVQIGPYAWEIGSWPPEEDQGLILITRRFGKEMEEYPEWNCPRVRIVEVGDHEDYGPYQELLAVYPGGILTGEVEDYSVMHKAVDKLISFL